MSTSVQESNSIFEIITNCPWLWWLGMAPGEFGQLRRRVTDRSLWLKILTLLLVPGLTAAGAFTAAWYGMKISQREVQLRVEQGVQVDQQQNDAINNAIQSVQLLNATVAALTAQQRANDERDRSMQEDIRELRARAVRPN